MNDIQRIIYDSFDIFMTNSWFENSDKCEIIRLEVSELFFDKIKFQKIIISQNISKTRT